MIHGSGPATGHSVSSRCPGGASHRPCALVSTGRPIHPAPKPLPAELQRRDRGCQRQVRWGHGFRMLRAGHHQQVWISHRPVIIHSAIAHFRRCHTVNAGEDDAGSPVSHPDAWAGQWNQGLGYGELYVEEMVVKIFHNASARFLSALQCLWPTRSQEHRRQGIVLAGPNIALIETPGGTHGTEGLRPTRPRGFVRKPSRRNAPASSLVWTLLDADR